MVNRVADTVAEFRRRIAQPAQEGIGEAGGDQQVETVFAAAQDDDRNLINHGLRQRPRRISRNPFFAFFF